MSSGTITSMTVASHPARVGGVGRTMPEAIRARSGGRSHQGRRQQLSVRLSLFLVALCAVFLLIGGAADAGEVPGPSREYVVAQGDTLWAIASGVAGEGDDIREIVALIMETSGIESSTIHPGQILHIPVG